MQTTEEITLRCPRCSNSPTMHKSEFLSIVPTMGEEKYGTQGKVILEKAGVPVRIYECLACHLLEFYHEEKKS